MMPMMVEENTSAALISTASIPAKPNKRLNRAFLVTIVYRLDHRTPTMTLAVDMQIDALACNAGLREGSLPTYGVDPAAPGGAVNKTALAVMVLGERVSWVKLRVMRLEK